MKLKKIIKSFIMFFKAKKYVPIIQVKEENKIFENKVALISGGSGGIGLAIAKSLSDSGCKVFIGGTNEVKLKLIKEKYDYDYVVLNFNHLDSISYAINYIDSLCGKIDIFVNSSGVHTENVNFFEVSADEYDRVMDINLKGTFFACQKISNYMIEKRIKGSILLVSSNRGVEPAWSPYGLSKWAINGFTKGLAKMLCTYGINVNAISPGSTATELLGKKEGDEISTSENNYGRMITPEEVGTLAKLLVSDAGKMIDGEVVHISGGRGTFDIR